MRCPTNTLYPDHRVFIPDTDSLNPDLVSGEGNDFLYSGLFTPPQSSLECRRGSLPPLDAFDSPYSTDQGTDCFTPLSDPHMEGSSLYGDDTCPPSWIHPSTSEQTLFTGAGSIGAVQDINSSFLVDGNSSLEVRAVETDQHCHSCGSYDGFDPLRDPASHEQHGYSTVRQPMCVYGGFANDSAFDMYPLVPGHGLHTPSLSTEMGSTGSSFAGSSPIPAFYNEAPQPNQQMLPMIAPSQLTPHDEFTPRLLGTEIKSGVDDYFSAFSTPALGYNCYQSEEPSTVKHPYFTPQAEQKWEDLQLATLPEQPQDASIVEKSPPRRRISRRQRESRLHSKGKCFNKYTSVYGTECRFEGKKFRLEGDLSNGHLNWVPEETTNPNKSHRCPHLDENGNRCAVSFERSEHLKRHVDTRHSHERKFPCPLPDCIDKKGNERRIGRSDNAGDHFKTHLRPKAKGRRNKQYDWPTVRRHIRAAYDTKRANKLIEGLQRWVDRGMPEQGKR